ncbi:hypothetical protein MUG91_G92n11 [Manis pentadactyla]|nr:hypothetical protein MUG91_G92n11 [Manis pentadactyla]
MEMNCNERLKQVPLIFSPKPIGNLVQRQGWTGTTSRPRAQLRPPRSQARTLGPRVRLGLAACGGRRRVQVRWGRLGTEHSVTAGRPELGLPPDSFPLRSQRSDPAADLEPGG